jgi:hypothetical protein
MPFRPAVFALLCVLAAGCGRGDRAELAAVSGTVNYAGSPLPSGTIIFETAGARPAVGKIEAGRIVEVTTYEPGDGVPVGRHKVSIQSVSDARAVGGGASPADSNADPATYMATASLIPQKYGNPETSGLTAEVNAGETNELSFDLEKE